MTQWQAWQGRCSPFHMRLDPKPCFLYLSTKMYENNTLVFDSTHFLTPHAPESGNFEWPTRHLQYAPINHTNDRSPSPDSGVKEFSQSSAPPIPRTGAYSSYENYNYILYLSINKLVCLNELHRDYNACFEPISARESSSILNGPCCPCMAYFLASILIFTLHMNTNWS